ncbi:MAG: S-layer homology domain-containing protein [Candidatus Peribacteria bacterium]|nr:S-layer homology domain-containing protein [Candidatus Peribacteria bacterium]
MFNDISNQSADLQSYIIKACELGLMGLEADGQTVKSTFKPNETITLAEVATTISRFLRGATYRGSEEWRYQNHLLALQKAGIIPRNVNPMRPELRGNIFVFFSTLLP